MGRLATPSTTSLAVVRAYFGITQWQLAQWLDASRGLVTQIEAHRKPLGGDTIMRLLPLLRLLPPPRGFGEVPAPVPAAPVGPLPVPAPGAGLLTPPSRPPGPLDARAAAPLRVRLRTCRHEILLIAREQVRLQHLTQWADRWRAALPVLRAALPPLPERLRAHLFLDDRAAELADTTDPATGPLHPVALARLALRRALLEAEAAYLAEWLEE